MERPFVWQMVREAVQQLGGQASYGQIRSYIGDKWGEVNPSTITCQTIACTVNHSSRVHYPENKKARKCEEQYDFLFRTARGQVEVYDPARHGMWELRINSSGSLEPALCPDDFEGEIVGLPVSLSFGLERELRDFIAANISDVRPDGVRLALYADENGDGVEYLTGVGPIDILAEAESGDLVIFELKLTKGPDKALGQLLRYMGWIKAHLAAGRKVRGVIVARAIDDKLRYAVSLVPDVSLFEYSVSFDLEPVACLGISAFSS